MIRKSHHKSQISNLNPHTNPNRKTQNPNLKSKSLKKTTQMLDRYLVDYLAMVAGCHDGSV
jgi:hypothetical protein